MILQNPIVVKSLVEEIQQDWVREVVYSVLVFFFLNMKLHPLNVKGYIMLPDQFYWTGMLVSNTF